MVRCQINVIVVLILLCASFPSSINHLEESSRNNSTKSIVDDSGWKKFSHPESSTYEMTAISGRIFSPLGIFDPLFDPVPGQAGEEFGKFLTNDFRIFIVQANSHDLHSLSSELTLLGAEVVDYLPDSSLIVELPILGQAKTIEKINQNPQVRWIGAMPTSWKLSPDLYKFISANPVNVDLDVTLFPGTTQEEVNMLRIDLLDLGNNFDSQLRCDIRLCQLRAFESSTIPIIAHDPLVMAIEPGPQLQTQNSNASRISNIDSVQSIFQGVSLTGAGEVIGVSDTGLDSDHMDFEGRLRNPIYNQFGPDESGDDTNSGHGTHVTATLLGGGVGDSNATGMAPDSTFHFYQLEVDNTGTLARWGSLYEMFSHSRLNGASIQTNSWGSESQLGQYTADSRSVDEFVNDNPDFLVLFSAGDLSDLGVTPPSTAKNALSVGASTTGSFGTIPPGQTHEYSSQGPTLDGRIKPDIVAPGVMICSARAEEASSASGEQCSQTTHSDGTTPLYMTQNGSSMATPVVSGAAALTRQYLREGHGISAPRSDLIRAVLLNGADDIGQPNIPNYAEGWGQLNLSNSLKPMSGNENLTLLFDYERQLFPGHSFVYTFDVIGGGGLDATLTWNDREASSNANQSAATLVNDLDLVITSPDGTTYLGNNFLSGFSVQGNSPDRLNNVERIRLPSAQSGIWTIEIGHAGGFLQDFSLIVSANASEVQSSDLTVVQNSISPSDTSPLQGDTILIQMSWANQAAAPTGEYQITLEDLTSGDLIGSYNMQSLAGGNIESFSVAHSFSTTGEHTLRLTLDTLNQVEELNDAETGINNNVYEVTVEVTQIGVRVTALNADGSIPLTPLDLNIARSKSIDPSIANWVNFPLEFRNEGTSEITLAKSISSVQKIDEFGILNQPTDEWWGILNDSSDSWTLSPAGQEGDRIYVTLNISNQDSLITGDSDSIYAIPGTFVSDIRIFDKNAPTIFHNIRLSIEVARVEGIYTVSAGTSGLGAEPGEIAEYSISVKNIGNGPTLYSISCETTNRWVVQVHDGQSSEMVIGPVLRQEFRTVDIRIIVPQSSLEFGAGFKEYIECLIVSVNDQSVSSIENALVEVMESMDFETELFDSNNQAIGPSALAETISVKNGDYVASQLNITNFGNVNLEFEVMAQSSNIAWPIQVFLSEEQPPIGAVSSISIIIQPGKSSNVTIRTVVPLAASMGESNKITIRTSLLNDLSTPTIVNATFLEVREDTTLDISIGKEFTVAMGASGLAEIGLQNSGNVPLNIQLTLGTLPDGWSGGFLSGNSFTMDMNKESIISIALDLSDEEIIEPGLLMERVAVIIESSSSSGITETTTVDLSITVVRSVWITIDVPNINLQDIKVNQEIEVPFTVNNYGNIPSEITLESMSPIGWDTYFSNIGGIELESGGSFEASLFLKPKGNAKDGLMQIRVFANSTILVGSNQLEAATNPVNADLSLSVSKERTSHSGGLSGFFESMGLPAWSLALIFALAVTAIATTVFRMRQSTLPIRNEEELIPKGSALQAGTQEHRREVALDTYSAGDVVTGDVSETEIEEAMSAVLPSLPSLEVPEGAAPLPLTGLPDGWTMEQWVSYGHAWWEQNGPK